jgi:endoglucanase
VQGFNTNVDHTVNFAVLPKDTVAKRLMMEVHFYDPYHFTIDEKSTIWQWGANATDPAATDTWGNEAHVDAQFQKLKTRFVDQGVPIILGEFAVLARPQFAGSENFRVDWNRYVARSAFTHGAVPIYWDNGYTNANSMGLFNRNTGEQVYPAIINAIVNAAK